ncbi:MAG: ATPase, partial [Methylococcaceae bacterium]|nr:ATPase [Methylococcaceae bacterium]MDP3903160.1 ATPase [Methylococcaceae bacterium]
MKMTPQQFLDWPSKRITLLAMSGAGKTTLANKLPKDNWFHYSGDYRIGTKYLGEPILDNIKRQAMQVPFLRELLLSDSISINNNITVDNLAPVSTFLSKLGNAELGGLSLSEFKRRQKLHHQAEIAAMLDVPEFIHKAEDI